MRDAGFTKQERHLIALLRVWTVVFLGAGVLFAVAPDWTIRYIEKIGSGVFGWTSSLVELGTERFWLVLTVSLMATLTYLAYKAQSDLLRHTGSVRALLLAKFASTAGFVVCFLTVQKSFIYLTGAVIDGCILIITAVLYHAAMKSRPHI